MIWQFNKKELDELLKKLVVVIDTKEKENKHIISFFEKKKIPYMVKNLAYGDYSCMLPKGSFQDQKRDIYFYDNFVIERKNSIEELIGNLKEDAARLKKELAHLNKYNIKFNIFVEDLNFEENLRKGSGEGYRSQYNSKALTMRLYGFEAEYNTTIVPVKKEIMGSKIYNFMRMHVRNLLYHEGFIDLWEDVENED